MFAKEVKSGGPNLNLNLLNISLHTQGWLFKKFVSIVKSDRFRLEIFDSKLLCLTLLTYSYDLQKLS